MRILPAIRKWTHTWAVVLAVLALLFVPAVPVHAEEGTSAGTSASSDHAAETSGASADASEDIIAQETDYYIKSLFVDITVREDNVFDVTETCVYDCLQPHHGPVREIPENHYR